MLEKESRGVEYSYKAKCPCGNITKKAPRTFQKSLKCKTCTNREKAEAMRLTVEDARGLFENNGIVLLEESYENSKTPMKCICPCGRTTLMSYDHVRRGGLCSGCAYERNGRRNYTYEEAVIMFEQLGLELLTTGKVRMKDGVEYKCECGRIGYSIFANVLKGSRCRDCTIENNSGDNHPMFDPEMTDEERARKRIDIINSNWSYDVRSRDEFSCQICRYNRGTVAHHVFSYKEYPELRTELDNGVTLCMRCHQDFHQHYGYGKNDLDQFLTYLMWRWEVGNEDTLIRH